MNMMFAEIIRNAGLNPSEYENASNVPITLYDGKDRPSSKETVDYFEPLFKKNDGSLQNFKNFLLGIEKETIESMNVRVDIDSVILFYKTPRAILFRRCTPMDPIDFME